MLIFSKIQKAERLPRRLKGLYLHIILRNIALGLVGIFGPIFIYVLSGSLKFVLIFYGVTCLLYFFLMPLWAKLLKSFSLRHLMAVGNLFLLVYFVIFYFTAETGILEIALIILLILVDVLSRAFYWVPYHVDLARFVGIHHRGRQLSFLGIIVSLLSIILPLLSAYLIAKFGFATLFLLTIFVLLFSFLPFLMVPETRENYSFGFWQTFQKLLAKKHLKTNLAYFADGFQDYLGALIWPIFIFLILKGQYLEVGIISSVIILAGCFLRYFIGEFTDRFDKNKLMKTGSVLYALGWVLKMFATSGWHIFIVGVYHDFTSIIMRTPLDVLTYEIAADEGHYIDEFTILREMSLNLGRVAMVILCLILLNFFSLASLFILGALLTLLVNLVSKEEFYLARRH